MFFVILNHPNAGVIAPLMDSDDGEQVASFETEEAAVAAIETNILGRHYGGKVFNLDEPVHEA